MSIFWCAEHGRFWSLHPTARTVLKAPKRTCPDCLKVPREEEQTKHEQEIDEYAQYLASLSD